jgi:nucleoside-diphosphate-sugar epimerase
MACESDRAVNEDFNISTAQSTTVLELAEMVWKKIEPKKHFRYECDPPFPHDVQVRRPEVSKAREVLGFEARTLLDQVLDEVIPWINSQLRQGRM